MREYYAQERHGQNYTALNASVQAGIDQEVRQELQSSRYQPDRVEYSDAEVYAHQQVREEYVERYYEGDRERGIPEGQVPSAEEAEEFADFALWTAWIPHTDRPDSEASFTNDWPYSPAAGNDAGRAGDDLERHRDGAAGRRCGGRDLALPVRRDSPNPTRPAFRSRIRAKNRPDPEPAVEHAIHPHRCAPLHRPDVPRRFARPLLRRARRLLRPPGTDRFDIPQWLPWSIARTWHIDLGILWIATMWLGAGLFLAPLLTGREPPKQALYVKGLIGALLVVAVGGLAGIWLRTTNNVFDGQLWWLLGNEGLEYLEIGRVWQFGLLVGFLGWTALVARGFKPLLDREPRYGWAHMIVYAGGSIGLLFVAGFLYTPQTNIVTTEFWRWWWVVHMWVEGVFEFFIVVVIALTLVSMNLLTKKSAEKAVIFQAALVMGSGIIGVSHHYWWVGLPEAWLPIGSVFSTLEFIPSFSSSTRHSASIARWTPRGRTSPTGRPSTSSSPRASGTSSGPA